MNALAIALLACAPSTGGDEPAPTPRATGLVVLLGAEALEQDVAELRDARGVRVALRIGEAPSSAAREELVALDPGARFAADDAVACARVRAAARVDLEGGALREWLALLYPQHRESALLQALREAHGRGALLVGRGACAALLSAAALDEALSAAEAVERNPHRRGRAQLVPALGFQPWALFDDSARSGGSFERLVDALVDERLGLGIFLGPRAALVVERDAGLLRGAGAGWSAIFDARRARRAPGSLREARLTLLAAGDVFARRERDGRLADESPQERATEQGERRSDVEHAFSLTALVSALDAAPLERGVELVLTDPSHQVRMAADERSTVRAARDTQPGAWAELRLDLAWPARR